MPILRKRVLGIAALLSLAAFAPLALKADETATAAPATGAAGTSPTTKALSTAAPAETVTAQSAAESTTAQSDLEPVVVKAKTLSQAAAFNQMHDSINKVNVLSEQQIAQTPFKTVGQAVQELPGVGVQHDEGVPIYMQIRGTDENLNILTYNSTLIPSFVPSESAVEVDAIPVGVVSNMELYKVILPNMDAQGIGGQLNLVPKSAFNYPDGLIQLDVEGTYTPEFTSGPQWTGMASGTYAGDLTWGETYQLGGGKKLGVLLTGNYANKDFGIDDLEATYSSSVITNALSPKSVNDYSFRHEYYDRENSGIGANFNLFVNDDTKYFLNFFGSGYDEWRDPKLLTQFNNIDVVPGDTVNSDGSFTVTVPAAKANDGSGAMQIESELTHVLKENRTLAGELGGENKVGGIKFDYAANYAWASFDEPDDFSYKFVNNAALGGSITYNNSGNNGNGPSFNTSNLTGFTPSNMILSSVKNAPSDNYTNQFGLKADGTLDTHFDGGDTGKIQFGMAGRVSYSQYNQNTYEGKANSKSNGNNPLTMADVQGPAYDYTYPGAPGGEYEMGPSLGPSLETTNLNPYFNKMAWQLADPVADLAADWSSTQQIVAGYAMYTFTANKLTIVGGARLEVTNIQTSWFNAYTNNGTVEDTLSQVTRDGNTTSYANLLPGLGFKYDYTPLLTSRLNYSETIARPTFEQYVPAIGQDSPLPGTNPDDGSDLVEGNVQLKPMVSYNFDFSTEWYPQKGAILSVDLFDKEISDYFTTNYQLTDGGQGSLVTFSNIPSLSQIYGYELQYQQQYTFLPWGLDGLGIRGSWDQNNSRGETSPGVWTQLPSQSDLVWDAGVFYKKAGWTFDVNGAFTGHNLQFVGDQDSPNGPTPNVYYDDYFQIDAKIEYAFNKHFKAHISGDNLNNAPLRFYQGPGSNYPIQCEYYGPSFDGGISVIF